MTTMGRGVRPRRSGETKWRRPTEGLVTLALGWARRARMMCPPFSMSFFGGGVGARVARSAAAICRPIFTFWIIKAEASFFTSSSLSTSSSSTACSPSRPRRPARWMMHLRSGAMKIPLGCRPLITYSDPGFRVTRTLRPSCSVLFCSTNPIKYADAFVLFNTSVATFSKVRRRYPSDNGTTYTSLPTPASKRLSHRGSSGFALVLPALWRRLESRVENPTTSQDLPRACSLSSSVQIQSLPSIPRLIATLRWTDCCSRAKMRTLGTARRTAATCISV
mmetsp:Transcript_92327/g.246964  ORF Transcript_92327/g.246964 Transcript_92327/m.246964 type:complete len:278 (-) Transcript_92327:339-1172(-)